MALIKYTGLSHYRQLLASDLKKAGVEVDKAMTFARHEIVEVADDVAEAIHQLVGDEFEKVEGDVNKELVRNADENPQPANVVPGSYVPPATVEPAATDAPNDATQQDWVTKEQAPQTGSPAEVEGPQ